MAEMIGDVVELEDARFSFTSFCRVGLRWRLVGPWCLASRLHDQTITNICMGSLLSFATDVVSLVMKVRLAKKTKRSLFGKIHGAATEVEGVPDAEESSNDTEVEGGSAMIVASSRSATTTRP